MSRGGSGGHTRVLTARKRTAQSTRWLERQLNDPYVKRAKADEMRAKYTARLLEASKRVREEPQPAPESIWDYVFADKNYVAGEK